MTKFIKLGKDGRPVSDGSSCFMVEGTAETVTLNDAAALAAMIGSCRSPQALSLGVVKPEYQNGATPIPVVTKAALATAPPGTIARTKEHFEFPAGQPGPMLLDHDLKGMPAEVAAKIAAAGGYWPALCTVVPEFAGAERVSRASTSAGLSNAKTGEAFPGSGGRHDYVMVEDASDIPRAIRALADRATLMGFGWAWVSAAGAILDRGIIDASKVQPHDLCFEGPPIVQPPLEQDPVARRPVATAGKLIDTRATIPDLTPAEAATLKTMRQAAREERRAEAAPIRAAHIETLVARTRQAGSSIPAGLLAERIAAAYAGRLAPEFVLVFDDPKLGEQTVAAVLADLDRFSGETLADPLEGVAYGRGKAMVMPTAASVDRVVIHSFAHGGMNYELLLDQRALTAMIESAAPDQVVRVLVENLDRTALFPGGEEALVKTTAKISKMTQAAIGKTLNKAREKRARVAAAERMAQARATDPRTVIRAPAADAEIGVVAVEIDILLAGSRNPEPAFRGINGRLGKIVDLPVVGLHQLEASSVNPPDEEGEEKAGKAKPKAKPKPPPPPAEVRIVELVSPVGIAEELERHVRLVRERPDGKEVFVRADPTICEAVNQRHGRSKLPTVKGVLTLPLVLRRADGSFEYVVKEGVDSWLGVYVHVPRWLAEGLPDPAGNSPMLAYEAYQWLADVWLADVDTDADGKALLIAIALTLIERMLLVDARPGFFVTAPQMGSGKTTVITMIAYAVFGRPASASAWSEKEEEIRKALFAYLRQGVALLVWDNVKRGTLISSPVVEASKTSEFIEDRVLGYSQTEKASATTIQVWTGNAIRPKDESTGRDFVVNLRASRVDPENRHFRHPDPYAWTLAHRAEILLALYEILTMPRPVVAQGKTRMKEWWRMVGHPLELLAGVDFGGIMTANVTGDPTRVALGIVMRWLVTAFGDKSPSGKRPFTAQDAANGLRQLKEPSNPADAFKDEDEDAKKPPLSQTELDAQAKRAAKHAAWRAAQAEVDARRAALEELAGGPFPPREDPTPPAVGAKLAAIVNRPCVIDGKTYRLTVKRDHNQNQYEVENVAGV
jgi:hypothetical protein